MKPCRQCLAPIEDNREICSICERSIISFSPHGIPRIGEDGNPLDSAWFIKMHGKLKLFWENESDDPSRLPPL